ncbi:hypothetical protein ACW5WN_18295 [Aeromonas lacus]|uniref:hypothetical protein n=1 Tax=Aeromonas lacus TaxID=558884 RepID=UPI000A52A196|nr:hypothetical protein [Aeromonas lacus]
MKFKVKRWASALMLAGILSGVSGSLLAISSTPSAPIQGHAPVASALEFAPAPIGTESVALEWRFSDGDGDAEQSSRYVWSIVDDDDISTPISGAESATLATIPEAAINKRVQACVTPRTNEATTLPSQGVPACLAAVVAPPVPLARDLSMTVKEADGLYTVNNTLTGTYAYSGIGNDVSRAIFAPHGQAESKLLAGGGTLTSSGVVADFPMTGLAGRKVELAVQPLSHYGGKGKIVVLKSDEYIYDPTLPPVIASFTPTPTHGDPNLAAVPYVLDRAGGGAGDQSEYRTTVGGVVVASGKTIGGAIPAYTVATGIYGGVRHYLTPVNGAGVKGAEVDLGGGFGSVVNVAAVPAIRNLNVTWSGAPIVSPAVGTVLQASYIYEPNGGSPAQSTRYAYRIYRDDTDAQKQAWINHYPGAVFVDPADASKYTIPSFTVPPQWAGEELELLVFGMSPYGVPATSVSSVRIPRISGSKEVVTNPSAKPSVNTAAVTGFGTMRTFLTFGVDNVTALANGGYPVQEIRYWWVGKQRATDKVTRYGPYQTLHQAISWGGGFKMDDYISIELQALNNGGIWGDLQVVSMESLGLGPDGNGYFYDPVTTPIEPVKPSFTLNNNGIEGAGLRPKKLLSATYSFTPTLGTKDQTTYSWNSATAKTITEAGKVPAYEILESDVGRVIVLKTQYVENDGNGYSDTSVVVNTSTEGFEGGIVLEDESSGESESFDLVHGKLGYLYLPAPRESENIYHTWATASAGCSAKGAGWRLPGSAELVAISAGKVKRPGNWPQDHLYWTSEEVAKPDYRTVYLETGDIVIYGGGSPNPDGMTTPAVCVKPQS